MNSPDFLQQMSGALSNPQVLDQIIASDPRLAGAGPQIRQYMQSEAFRNMVYVLPFLRHKHWLMRWWVVLIRRGCSRCFGCPR